METLCEPPNFDGKKWKCACGATLATVEKDERDEFDSAAQRFSKRTVATLEIPEGYLHHEGRAVWLRPRNVLPFQRGAQEQAKRKELREFALRRIETARRKGDPSTVVFEEGRLRDQEARRFEPSAPVSTGQAKPTRFSSEQLPIRIECPDPHCKRVWPLLRIKKPMTRPNATQERAG